MELHSGFKLLGDIDFNGNGIFGAGLISGAGLKIAGTISGSSLNISGGNVKIYNGKIGVGCIPALDLDVAGDMGIIREGSSSGNSGLRFYGNNVQSTFPANDVCSYIINIGNSSSGIYPWDSVGNLVIQPRTSTGAPRDIIFATGPNVPLPRMVILSTGEIGIGTTTPSNLLEISGGNICVSGSGVFRYRGLNGWSGTFSGANNVSVWVSGGLIVSVT